MLSMMLPRQPRGQNADTRENLAVWLVKPRMYPRLLGLDKVSEIHLGVKVGFFSLVALGRVVSSNCPSQ